MQAVFFIEEYLKKNGGKWIQKTGFVFPFRINSLGDLQLRRKSILEKRVTTFVISGNVNKRSRDYSLVFSALSSMNEPFRLVLLGGVSDFDVVEMGRRILGEKLVTFGSYLPENEYEEHLINAHFLIGCVKEGVYGKWQGTGIEFDGPTFGIPTLVPKNAFPENQNGFFLRYDSDASLKNLIKKGISSVENGTYETDFLNPGIRHAEFFLEEKWREKILSQIAEVNIIFRN